MNQEQKTNPEFKKFRDWWARIEAKPAWSIATSIPADGGFDGALNKCASSHSHDSGGESVRIRNVGAPWAFEVYPDNDGLRVELLFFPVAVEARGLGITTVAHVYAATATEAKNIARIFALMAADVAAAEFCGALLWSGERADIVKDEAKPIWLGTWMESPDGSWWADTYAGTIRGKRKRTAQAQQDAV